jgi:hypothetical protein
MSLLDGANGSPAGRRVRVGELRVAGLQPAQWIQAVFGDHVRLRGYDLRQSPDVLSLTLFWQALSEMDSSYKVFVHLTDPVSGEIVAQVDTVPRQWTYPTNQWIKGEVVRDVVRLPLQDVPPGQYALLIGWYDPVTGRRLPTYGSQDERYPGDALSVTPVEVE